MEAGARHLLLSGLLGVLVSLPPETLHADSLRGFDAATAGQRPRQPSYDRSQLHWIDKLSSSLAPALRKRTLAWSPVPRGGQIPVINIVDGCRGSLEPRYGRRRRLRVYDEQEFLAAAGRISRRRPVGALMPLCTVIENADGAGKPTGELTIIDSRGTRTVKAADATVVSRVPSRGLRGLLARAPWRRPARSEASGLGDLTRAEVAQIQRVVDGMGGGGLVVGGSAARARRRNPGRRWLPIGKGPGTRSDIDYFAWSRHLGRVDDLALPEVAHHGVVNLDSVVVYDRQREVDIKEAIANKPFIVFQPGERPRLARGKLPTFE